MVTYEHNYGLSLTAKNPPSKEKAIISFGALLLHFIDSSNRTEKDKHAHGMCNQFRRQKVN